MSTSPIKQADEVALRVFESTREQAAKLADEHEVTTEAANSCEKCHVDGGKVFLCSYHEGKDDQATDIAYAIRWMQPESAIAGGQTQRDHRAEPQANVGRDPAHSETRAESVEEKP